MVYWYVLNDYNSQWFPASKWNYGNINYYERSKPTRYRYNTLQRYCFLSVLQYDSFNTNVPYPTEWLYHLGSL